MTLFLSIDKHCTASFSFKDWNLITAKKVATGEESKYKNVDVYTSGYLSMVVLKKLLGGDHTHVVPPLAATKYLKKTTKVRIRVTVINSVNDAAFDVDKHSHPQSLQSHGTQ